MSLKDKMLYAEDYAGKDNIGRLYHVEDVDVAVALYWDAVNHPEKHPELVGAYREKHPKLSEFSLNVNWLCISGLWRDFLFTEIFE